MKTPRHSLLGRWLNRGSNCVVREGITGDQKRHAVAMRLNHRLKPLPIRPTLDRSRWSRRVNSLQTTI